MKRFSLVAALAALVLSACGSDPSSDGGDEKGWSYKSADGKTYTADEVPARIIAQGEAAAALMSFGIKPKAVFLNDKLENVKALRGFDMSGIEILGETWGEIDAEKAAAIRPDLIVTTYWPVEKTYGGLEDGVKEESKKVGKLAPVVGATAGESVLTMIDGFETLAESLGADVDDPKIAAHKAAFEKVRDRFKDVVAEKKGLTALGVSPADDLLYVAVPEHSAELTDFTEWGLDVTVPRDPDKKFPYWENLSWENADKYQPDLLLLDDRNYETSMKSAQKQPTWKKIKAAEEDAVVPWPAYWISTYEAYAEELEKLSDSIEKADPDLT
jgi:iron complex transport system substrate-binding protein